MRNSHLRASCCYAEQPASAVASWSDQRCRSARSRTWHFPTNRTWEDQIVGNLRCSLFLPITKLPLHILPPPSLTLTSLTLPLNVRNTKVRSLTSATSRPLSALPPSPPSAVSPSRPYTHTPASTHITTSALSSARHPQSTYFAAIHTHIQPTGACTHATHLPSDPQPHTRVKGYVEQTSITNMLHSQPARHLPRPPPCHPALTRQQTQLWRLAHQQRSNPRQLAHHPPSPVGQRSGLSSSPPTGPTST
ncbi:hypothetical protein V8E36_001210 [Tilletia maclaganii]